MPDGKDENRKAVTAGISNTDGAAIRRMVEAAMSSKAKREALRVERLAREQMSTEDKVVKCVASGMSIKMTLSLTMINRSRAARVPSAPTYFPNQVFYSSGAAAV